MLKQAAVQAGPGQAGCVHYPLPGAAVLTKPMSSANGMWLLTDVICC